MTGHIQYTYATPERGHEDFLGGKIGSEQIVSCFVTNRDSITGHEDMARRRIILEVGVISQPSLHSWWEKPKDWGSGNCKALLALLWPHMSWDFLVWEIMNYVKNEIYKTLKINGNTTCKLCLWTSFSVYPFSLSVHLQKVALTFHLLFPSFWPESLQGCWMAAWVCGYFTGKLQ